MSWRDEFGGIPGAMVAFPVFTEAFSVVRPARVGRVSSWRARWRRVLRLSPVLLVCFFALCPAPHAQALTLKNDRITADFGPAGLTSIRDASGYVYRFSGDSWAVSIDKDLLRSATVTPRVQQESAQQIAYTYASSGYTIRTRYTLKPGWNFVSRQIEILSAPAGRYVVHSIEPLWIHTVDVPDSIYVPGTYTPHLTRNPIQNRPTSEFAAFLRFPNRRGLMLVVQNPFLHILHEEKNVVRVTYQPEMEWRKEWGIFRSDIACIGPYEQTGRYQALRLTLEWKQGGPGTEQNGADEGEVAAFTAAVRAFLMSPSPKPIRVEVGWTLNDYEIDVSTPQGRSEYKRVIDATAALGIKNLLYSGADSSLASEARNADSWQCEYTLWLDLGQKIREGKWDPDRDVLPENERSILDYARSRHVGILAYVYPSVPYAGNPSWLVSDKAQPGYQYATLASRALQDMLIHDLLVFKRKTGIAGYSFDYTFLNLPGSTAYAQWWGWRRIMEALRKADPEMIIDGRQTYQTYGPWTWLAGNYPHPTGTDEQPESFTPYPDLHFDRVSADRMRFVNYWYRNYEFTPEEIMPGYAFHQTERFTNLPGKNGSESEEHAERTKKPYRTRDWDQLGFRYSLLSSIATAGWNNVINMIPARDPAEASAFQLEDQQWIREWLAWADSHQEYLLHTRNILGQPAMGKVDGTSAIFGDHGFLFLFNPDYKQHTAEIALDASIGLNAKGAFSVRELYPRKGGYIGKPDAGLWSYGDRLEVPMDGTSAVVLEIGPSARLSGPRLFDADAGPSTAVHLSGGTLSVSHVSGEPGTDRTIGVLLPEQAKVTSVEVNGKAEKFSRNGKYVTTHVRFAGIPFSQAEEIALAPAHEGALEGNFTVPSRIQHELRARAASWPVPWTKEDYRVTWLAPERLLLFVQFAEPKQGEKPELTLDGKPLAVTAAYSSIRLHKGSFVGWYVDLSDISPDVSHRISVRVPKSAEARFQGLFFDNVEPQWTEELVDSDF